MRGTSLVFLVLAVGCGLGDPPAPYTCTGAVFGRVESEKPIDCAAWTSAEQLARTEVARHTAVDMAQWGAVAAKTTVHVRSASTWTCDDASSGCRGESWAFPSGGRIDLSPDHGMLAHETLHLVQMANGAVDSFTHPGWTSNGFTLADHWFQVHLDGVPDTGSDPVIDASTLDPATGLCIGFPSC